MANGIPSGGVVGAVVGGTTSGAEDNEGGGDFDGSMLPPSDVVFEKRIEELTSFRAEHGHCLVPQKYNTLGIWVNGTRSRFRHRLTGVGGKNLTEDKIKRLENLGFVWSVDPARHREMNEQAWTRRFEDLEGEAVMRELSLLLLFGKTWHVLGKRPGNISLP